MKRVLLIVCAVLLKLTACANETFIPTDTWKTVQEGQAIPTGLHVRINLQTGKKEAKLLSDVDSSKDKQQSSLIKVETDQEKDEPIDLDELKKVLKNIKNDEVDQEENDVKKFRSYEEIKKEFESVNMQIKTDFEIMAQLVTEFEALTKDPAPVPSNFVNVLTDLEYLVHQYDNAVEFSRLNGFSTIVLPTLNKTEDVEIRTLVLRIVGSATQSNPRVQQAAIEAGCIGALLKVLALDKDSTIRLRCLFALSCLLRSFPQAQLKFVQDGGVSVITSLFDDPKRKDEKTRLKIVTLLTDLLLESQGVPEKSKRKKLYEAVALEQSLREVGWCKKVSDWLSKQVDWRNFASAQEDEVDHEVIEAASAILLALADSCLADYVTNIDLLNAVNHAKQFYGDLVLLELDDGINDTFYSGILQKLRSLAGTFARNPEFKDEF